MFPIVFDLERANQLSLLPDKDLVDLCPLIESYQVTKSRFLLMRQFNINEALTTDRHFEQEGFHRLLVF
ncbi:MULTISPECIES: hypothetical protein [unclassified Microcystis]|uniref:hypothetical protein n=1 Tax=unclassified Microcystis TaxID=2643300 RepID=UPI00257F72E2|nr:MULTISPECIES: hypothetical protein [unclassified Microcystis]